MFALVDFTMLVNGETKDKLAVVVNGERICNVIPESDFYGDTFSLGGALLCAGFIDIQVNGGGGVLFNDMPDNDGIRAIYNAHRAFGTTSICPTIITDTKEKLLQAIQSFSKLQSSALPAIHIEGFYISEKKSGIHNKRYIKKLNESEAVFLNSINCKKIITIAPECCDKTALDILKSDRNNIIFGGHTNADCNEFTEFLDNTGVGCTHIYNAMSGLSGRAPGALGATLCSEKAYAGIIADGHHVSYDCVKIAKKCLGKRLFLVSDAMPPACSDIKEYMLYGEKVFVKNGVCVSENGVIAGSCLNMARAVKNMAEQLNTPLCDALYMATEAPAKLLLADDSLGSIKAGYYANFTVLSKQLLPVMTFVEGKMQPCIPNI